MTEQEIQKQLEAEARYQLANVLRERASRAQLRTTWFNAFALVVLLLAIGAAIYEAAR